MASYMSDKAQATAAALLRSRSASALKRETVARISGEGRGRQAGKSAQRAPQVTASGSCRPLQAHGLSVNSAPFKARSPLSYPELLSGRIPAKA
jgi:hypothetical protein